MNAKNILLVGLSLLTPLMIQAQTGVNSQISERLKTRLKQTKISDCGAAVREVQWGRTRLNYTSEGLRLDGLQLSGAAWQAIIPASNVLKCEVWSAVLQKGGEPSLMIFKAPDSGGIEGGELTILSFDNQSRPFPWKVTGSFTTTEQGITEVALDPTTEDAQVLVPVREGDPHSEVAQVTSLYKWQNDSFMKVVGTDRSGGKWPLISGSSKALTGKESLLTSSFNKADSVLEVASGDVKVTKRADFSEENPVILSNGERIKFPALLVLDKADGSRIIFTDENVVDGIDEVIKLAAAITLQGTACESEECRPFVMMARSASPSSDQKD